MGYATPPARLVYDYLKASASYQLNLANPHHRSVLRLLLKRSELAAGTADGGFACFCKATLNDRPFPEGIKQLCSKRLDRGGDDWQVPQDGQLNFIFQMPSFFKPSDSIAVALRNFTRSQRICV